jgi:hypothetical protein
VPDWKKPDWTKDVRPFAGAYPANTILESEFEEHAGLAALPRIGLWLRRTICIPSTTSYDGAVAVGADNPRKEWSSFRLEPIPPLRPNAGHVLTFNTTTGTK